MKFKKVLATAMVAAMAMSSALTVCAADRYPNWVRAKGEVIVAGEKDVTEVAGDYSAESVRGVAVTTDYEEVKTRMGLTLAQKPKVVIYDAKVKTDPDAMVTLNDAIESTQANSVAAIYFQLGAKENGKWVYESKINAAEVTVRVGLPKHSDPTKKYSVICVKENGVYTILDDLDNNGKTVTFNASTGVATYGIVTDAVVAAPVVPVIPVEVEVPAETEVPADTEAPAEAEVAGK